MLLADGGTLADHPGWAARSVLAMLFGRHSSLARIVLVCVRGLDTVQAWRVFTVVSSSNSGANAQVEALVCHGVLTECRCLVGAHVARVVWWQ